MHTCPNCGGTIEGDGYTLALHCENAELDNREPDAPVLLCDADRGGKDARAETWDHRRTW